MEKAQELKKFKDVIGHQIHTAVQYLRHNWFPALEAIFNQASFSHSETIKINLKNIRGFASD